MRGMQWQTTSCARDPRLERVYNPVSGAKCPSYFRESVVLWKWWDQQDRRELHEEMDGGTDE